MARSLVFLMAQPSRNELNYRDPVPISYVACDFGMMLIFAVSNNLISKRRGPVRRQQLG